MKRNWYGLGRTEWQTHLEPQGTSGTFSRKLIMFAVRVVTPLQNAPAAVYVLRG